MRLVPSLTSFQSIVSQTTANIPQVAAVIRDIHSAQDYLAHAEQVGHEPLRGEPRELLLENVTFTYAGRAAPAVHDLSLTVPFGTTLGLAGSSGAGKTTLVDIVLGLLVPQQGRVRVDDQEVTDVLADWRSRVGYVPQDVSLFDGTVAQNVALTWGQEIDLERVEQSLRRAQLWDVVADREGGMQARIGDRGMALSGGQRQRLGIARALYSDPLVLVLDEATSALDTKTESDVSQAIRSLRGEVTVVVVAHRLSTIRDADQVCFMRGGTIVARGRFEDVVAAEPEFARQAALAGLA
jgi:ABC-type multidrug transport system fused ATPase/permease subunit